MVKGPGNVKLDKWVNGVLHSVDYNCVIIQDKNKIHN